MTRLPFSRSRPPPLFSAVHRGTRPISLLLEDGLGGRVSMPPMWSRAADVRHHPGLDYDHQGIPWAPLITLIAGEKAGILKRGVPL